MLAPLLNSRSISTSSPTHHHVGQCKEIQNSHVIKDDAVLLTHFATTSSDMINFSNSKPQCHTHPSTTLPSHHHDDIHLNTPSKKSLKQQRHLATQKLKCTGQAQHPGTISFATAQQHQSSSLLNKTLSNSMMNHNGSSLPCLLPEMASKSQHALLKEHLYPTITTHKNSYTRPLSSTCADPIQNPTLLSSTRTNPLDNLTNLSKESVRSFSLKPISQVENMQVCEKSHDNSASAVVLPRMGPPPSRPQSAGRYDSCEKKPKITLKSLQQYMDDCMKQKQPMDSCHLSKYRPSSGVFLTCPDSGDLTLQSVSSDSITIITTNIDLRTLDTSLKTNPVLNDQHTQSKRPQFYQHVVDGKKVAVNHSIVTMGASLIALDHWPDLDTLHSQYDQLKTYVWQTYIHVVAS